MTLVTISKCILGPEVNLIVSPIIRLIFKNEKTPTELMVDSLCNSLSSELQKAININFNPKSFLCAFNRNDRQYLFSYFFILL